MSFQLRERPQEPGHHHFAECRMYDADPSEVYTGPPGEATFGDIVCTCFDCTPDWTLG